MRKRWVLWLVLLHVAITSIFVVREEIAGWESWKVLPRSWDSVEPEPPRWMTVVAAWAKGTKAPSPPPPNPWTLEYRPSTAEKGFNVVELPVALLVGWYPHLAPDTRPPLPLDLLPGTHRLRLHPRILLIEALMIVIVALHWWLVALVLKKKELFARWVGIPVVVITVGGIACALACLPPRDWRGADLLAFVPLIVTLMAWVWAFGASSAYAIRSAWLGARRRLNPGL